MQNFNYTELIVILIMLTLLAILAYLCYVALKRIPEPHRKQKLRWNREPSFDDSFFVKVFGLSKEPT